MLSDYPYNSDTVKWSEVTSFLKLFLGRNVIFGIRPWIPLQRPIVYVVLYMAMLPSDPLTKRS